MTFKLNDRVFDLPSGKVATIVEIIPYDEGGGVCYILDDSVPLDPTGDGAFPERGRNVYELCRPDDAERIAANTPYVDY